MWATNTDRGSSNQSRRLRAWPAPSYQQLICRPPAATQWTRSFAAWSGASTRCRSSHRRGARRRQLEACLLFVCAVRHQSVRSAESSAHRLQRDRMEKRKRKEKGGRKKMNEEKWRKRNGRGGVQFLDCNNHVCRNLADQISRHHSAACTKQQH